MWTFEHDYGDFILLWSAQQIPNKFYITFTCDDTHRSDGTHVIEKLHFQVGGPEDDNMQYVMQLSDELIYYILGRIN